MDDQQLFYDTIADQFDSLMSPYDLERRLDIVFDQLLPRNLTGLRMLDLGCGTGWFSQRAIERGADVISVDISTALARVTSSRAQTQAAVGDAAQLPFASDCFALVVCSEMLEHLREPEQGIREIERLLAPGGILALTTPNRRWLWLVELATSIGLRPYAGYENFLGFDELHQKLQDIGLTVETHRGFHLWPFQLAPLQPISRQIDQRFGFGFWRKWMINQAVRARKP